MFDLHLLSINLLSTTLFPVQICICLQSHSNNSKSGNNLRGMYICITRSERVLSYELDFYAGHNQLIGLPRWSFVLLFSQAWQFAVCSSQTLSEENPSHLPENTRYTLISLEICEDYIAQESYASLILL